MSTMLNRSVAVNQENENLLIPNKSHQVIKDNLPMPTKTPAKSFAQPFRQPAASSTPFRRALGDIKNVATPGLPKQGKGNVLHPQQNKLGEPRALLSAVEKPVVTPWWENETEIETCSYSKTTEPPDTFADVRSSACAYMAQLPVYAYNRIFERIVDESAWLGSSESASGIFSSSEHSRLDTMSVQELLAELDTLALTDEERANF